MKELSLEKKNCRLPGGVEEERSGVERSGTERSDDSTPPARQKSAALPARPIHADPEVSARPKSRRFTAEYKLRVVAEADRCDKPGQIGALLRREGLYSSHLSQWRKQRDAGALGALKAHKRGPAVAAPNPLAREVAQLQKDNARLEKKLQKAKAINEFQKKIAELLNIPMKPFVDEESD
jgi:transposase-like protein